MPVDDRPVRWHHFLTGRDDATIYNVSVLSRPAEWHALAVGVVGGVQPEVAVLVLTYIIGRQLGKSALPRNAESSNLHIRDAIREPAYWVAGWVTTRFVLSVVYGQPLIPETVLKLVGS